MVRYNAETIIGIVRTLTGSIEPVGETNEDNQRFENLKVLTTVVDHLLFDIDQVSNKKTRAEFSMARAGKYAQEFLDALEV